MTGAAPYLDEMVDEQGAIRPHWRPLVTALHALPGGGLADAATRLDRAFEEEGVTTRLPGQDAARTWRCDPIPLVLTAAEFAGIEAGLAQRARLLEAILADLYGPHALLAEGALPPALAFANPGFLRGCRMHALQQRGPLLHFYAADLVRGPDGAWRVLADRTDGAAGIGYARENRRMLARVLPEAFRSGSVRQMRPFFEAWMDALHALAPGGKANPHVALLTPGTAHPLWFEHMCLARELSCALVQDADLTVRGGGVFLKTLKGLAPVDVILRRTGGDSIDPVEFAGAGAGGVPGLMQALRDGAARMVNDPGTAAAQAPALTAFLPNLAPRLLGEALRLGSPPTMWLGEATARARVAANPEAWLIRPATDGTAPATALGELADDARRSLLARIAARPWAYAATTAVAPSTAPCVAPGGMEARPIVLRVFLINERGERWRAMAGGIARVVAGVERLAVRLPRQGLSKDVWVLSEDMVDIVGPAALTAPPMAVRRTAGDVPSRVADDLYWLGRYVERLEGAARLMRAALVRLTRGAPLPREQAESLALAACLADAGLVPREAADAPPGTAALPEALLASVAASGPVGMMFGQVARLTDAVRDRLTGDMYAHITQTLRAARSDARRVGRSLDALMHACVGIVRFSTGIAGIAAENLVHGGGFLFLDLGRRIERAQTTAANLANLLAAPPQRIEGGLRLALELCDSAITYRARYLTVLQAGPVLDLVLADPANPRALGFQLGTAARHLGELSGPEDALCRVAANIAADAETLVRQVVAAGVAQAEEAGELPAELRKMETRIGQLSDALARRYFALLPAAQTLGLGDGERPAIAAAA